MKKVLVLFIILFCVHLSAQIPVFEINPPSINFSLVKIGSSSNLPVKIKNTGTASLDISGITISNPEFTFPLAVPVSVPALDSITVTVTFAPTVLGAKLDSITINHNASGLPGKLYVSGRGYVDPSIKIDFTVTDNGTTPSELHSQALSLGLDASGTDGIDMTLGESGAPPFVPAGVEARLVLPPFSAVGNNTWKDYRGAIFPFTGQTLHRLAYQASTGASLYTLTFNNFTLPNGGSFTIQVIDLFGGVLVNRTLSTPGTVQVTTALTALNIYVNYEGADPLPVELTSFYAILQHDNRIILKWRTATELNNFGFDVEKSPDKISWGKIGFVAGFGTSNSPKQYEFQIPVLIFDKNYFRLKQIDADGKYKYSPVIEMDFYNNISFQLFQNYPNPFNPSTTINFSTPESGIASLVVYNTLGEEVDNIFKEKYLEPGSYNLTYNAGKLSGGVYLYLLTINNKSLVNKMILVK
jgi:hypothetical protein